LRLHAELEVGMGTEDHLLPLIIEIGTFVDVIEII
jgi:hypothetical protein